MYADVFCQSADAVFSLQFVPKFQKIAFLAFPNYLVPNDDYDKDDKTLVKMENLNIMLAVMESFRLRCWTLTSNGSTVCCLVS